MLNNKNLAAMEMTDDDIENVTGGFTHSDIKKFYGHTCIQNGIVCAITAAGDDITSIANFFGTTKEKIKALNPNLLGIIDGFLLPDRTLLRLGNESEIKVK